MTVLDSMEKGGGWGKRNGITIYQKMQYDFPFQNSQRGMSKKVYGLDKTGQCEPVTKFEAEQTGMDDSESETYILSLVYLLSFRCLCYPLSLPANVLYTVAPCLFSAIRVQILQIYSSNFNIRYFLQLTSEVYISIQN